MSHDDAAPLPYPSRPARDTAKPDTGRATTTNALGSATEESLKLARQLTALHNALRLTIAQAGRVLAVTTKPVGPPAPEGEREYSESDVMPVDEFGTFTHAMISTLGRFDCMLAELIVEGADTFAAVKGGAWEDR